MKICKYCDSENVDFASYCVACGGNEFKNKCNRCGTIFESAYCPTCGTKAGTRAKTCPRCGQHFFTPACPHCGYTDAMNRTMSRQTQTRQINTRPPVQSEEVSRKKVTFGRVLLWIFFLPIMVIITVWQEKKLDTIWKIVLTAVIAVALLFYCVKNRNAYEMVASSQSATWYESSRNNKTFDRTPRPTIAAKKVTPRPTTQVTATPKKEVKIETPKPTIQVTTEPKRANQYPGGGSKEFREMLDEYERFINSYCDFMEKFNDTKDISKLYVDYLNWLTKYAEWVAKINDIDENSLSKEDQLYYIDVMTRCSNRLIKAALQ